MSDSVVRDNSAEVGGGLAAGNAGIGEPRLSLVNSTVSDNTGYFGAGIYSVGAAEIARSRS